MKINKDKEIAVVEVDGELTTIARPKKPLFNKIQPLLSQLRLFKKACFKPYISNFQLIHYVCEQCSKERRYFYCDFYEAIHDPCFEKYLDKIQKDKSIPKPKIFHHLTGRLCYSKIKLEKIIRATFRIWKIEQEAQKKPLFENTPEWRSWKLKLNKNKKKLPCSSTCKMSEYCPFYKNNINRMLVITDIIGYDRDNIYFDDKTEITYDRGYIMKSYFYKTYIVKKRKKNVQI